MRQVTENGLRYLTLDDELTLLSAREDPVGMIRSLDRAVIDEIQRAPALLLAIKKSMEERKLAGLAGDSFKMGVLLYDGDETMPLGDGIWAAPLSTLGGT